MSGRTAVRPYKLCYSEIDHIFYIQTDKGRS